MSVDDEEEEQFDNLGELSTLTLNSRKDTNRFQVSGWENDDDGVEQEKHETPNKEILWAAENGELNVVKKLLLENIELLNVIDNDKYTPLHRACYNGHTDVVRYLLLSGADYTKETVDNWQPLHSACRWNQLDCAALLLTRGADINARSKAGATPLHLAAGHAEAQKLLELLLLHPDIITDLKDDTGDTPYDIARRSGPNEKFFEASEACFL